MGGDQLSQAGSTFKMWAASAVLGCCCFVWFIFELLLTKYSRWIWTGCWLRHSVGLFGTARDVVVVDRKRVRCCVLEHRWEEGGQCSLPVPLWMSTGSPPALRTPMDLWVRTWGTPTCADEVLSCTQAPQSIHIRVEFMTMLLWCQVAAPLFWHQSFGHASRLAGFGMVWEKGSLTGLFGTSLLALLAFEDAHLEDFAFCVDREGQTSKQPLSGAGLGDSSVPVCFPFPATRLFCRRWAWTWGRCGHPAWPSFYLVCTVDFAVFWGWECRLVWGSCTSLSQLPRLSFTSKHILVLGAVPLCSWMEIGFYLPLSVWHLLPSASLILCIFHNLK